LNLLFHTGHYFQLLGEVFSKPERFSLYWKRTVEEIDLLGVKSLGIVALLSLFMGAVITIQTKTNIDSAPDPPVRGGLHRPAKHHPGVQPHDHQP
jgi:phospholipid/cholesterol/gamma-HCH transport system permease protein